MSSPPPERPPKPTKPIKSNSLNALPRLPSLDKLPNKPLLSPINSKPPISPTHKQCLRLRLQKALSGGSLKIPASLDPSASGPVSPTSSGKLKFHSNSLEEFPVDRSRRVQYIWINGVVHTDAESD